MEVDLNQLVHKDQTIKIVPSVEESLQKLGVNTKLEETIQLWFNHLRHQWKTWKKSPTTDTHFNSLFHLTTDPYTVVLVCSVKCEEFKDSKPKSLPHYLIESLGEWSQANGKTPTDSLKLPAFQIAISQRNHHFLKLVLRTYHVYTIKETILPLVKEIISNDNCKQASQIVIAMDLHDDIRVEDLLFPLILQDKANMIDEYLTECPNQVRPLLLFLDRLLDKNFSIKDYAQHYIEENKVCHVRYEKIHYKPLGKLVARLCNKFNVPIETCKNLSKNRTTGGLRYLIHQKYIEHNVSSSVWDDLVKDSLNQSGCAQEFIDMLVDYDINEALKWASHFQLPENTLPLALKNMTLQEAPVATEEENWDDEQTASQNFYKLSLPDNNIIIIDTAEKFYDVVTSLVNCSIVSIDCEWKPSFGAVQSQVALIQIATFDFIYLIDTLILNRKKYLSLWCRFNKSVLDNAEIIKLGFGLEQDLKEIKASIIGLSNIKVKGEGLLDLSLLWKSVINLGLSLPSNEGNSLSSIVQACFGVPLEKAEQCSNWELRPLRKTQINYAALDAYVLLDIYDYLQKLCMEQKINFEEICNYIMLEQKMKTAKKTKVADNINTSTKNFQRCSKDVKLLIECELSDLAPYLRYCDIDTITVTLTMKWHDIVNLALSENRLILTTKLKISPTSKFPQNFILNVHKTTVKDQLQKAISSFNISVKKCDVFKRCLHCNGKDMKNMSSDEVKDLCNKYKSDRISKTYTNKRYVSDNEDDDAYCDNFLSDSDGDDYLSQPDMTEPSNKTHISTESCVTSKGAIIEITNVDRLSMSCKPATLCETCGKLYWDEDPLLKSVGELLSQLIDLSE